MKIKAEKWNYSKLPMQFQDTPSYSNPICDENLKEKVDKHKTSEKLEFLHIEKFNYEIWAEMVFSKPSSKNTNKFSEICWINL